MKTSPLRLTILFTLFTNIDATCPAGWATVGTACYFDSGTSGDYNTADTYCSAQGAKLPLLFDLNSFIDFNNWWTTKYPSAECWLGMRYNAGTTRWDWNNGCTFQFFPSFWYDYWNPYYIGTNTYAKFGNVQPIPAWANSSTGARTSWGTETTVKIVCYKPADGIPKPCFSFPPAKSSINTCSSGNWLCARDTTDGQMVTTANDADSCFCVTYASTTFTSAMTACQDSGGFLSDIRSQQEVAFLSANFGNGICQTGFSFYNGKCYWYSGSTTFSLSAQASETDCQNTKSSHSVSLHSLDELFFVYNLGMNGAGTIPWAAGDFGFYIGGYRADYTSPFVWADGSPFDYIPPWTSFPWWQQPDLDVGLAIPKDAGALHDISGALPYVCETPTQLWINELSSTTTFTCTDCASTTSTSPLAYNVVLNANGTLSPIAVSMPTYTAAGYICRKDRNVATTMGFCYGKIPCDVPTSTATAAATTTTTTVPTATTTVQTATATVPTTTTTVPTATATVPTATATVPTTTTTVPTATTTAPIATITVPTATTGTSGSEVKYYQKTCGKALNRVSVSQSLNTPSLNLCAETCTPIVGCLGINYSSNSSLSVNCELLTANSSTQGYTCDELFNYYERV